MPDAYDDLYDPYSLLRRQQPQQGRQQRITPLSPAEEDSLLGTIGGKVLGGIGYAGSVLEKTFGGRALRAGIGLLQGNPRAKAGELLSFIPGSDTFGLTDEADRVSGKDLLGLTDDSWGSTLAGLGAEIATDPATYLSFGGAALSRGGRVARAAGLLPGTVSGRATATLNDLVAAGKTTAADLAPALKGQGATLADVGHLPLGGVAGVGLPFAHPSFLLGTGQGGADFVAGLGRLGAGARKVAGYVPGAGPALDWAGNKLEAGGRYWKSWFDQPGTMGLVSKEGQQAAAEATEESARLAAGWKGRLAQVGQDLAASGRPTTDRGLELRQYLEGTLAGPPHPADVKAGAELRGLLDESLAHEQQLGLPVGGLQDVLPSGESLGYVPRQEAYLDRPTAGYGPRGRQPLVARDPRVESREDVLKGFVGGTVGDRSLEQALADPAVLQGPRLQSAAHVRSNYLGGVERTPGNAERFVDFARSQDPQRVEAALKGEPIPFFGNHPLTDIETRLERASHSAGTADAVHGLLARTAIDANAGALPAGARPVLDVLKDAGLDYNVANAAAGAQHSLLQKLAAAGKGQDLASLYVPAESAADVTRYVRGFTSPESLNPVKEGYKYLTNLFKAYQTSALPVGVSFHARNLMSGLAQNVIKGGFEPGLDPISGFLKPIRDAHAFTAGEVLADANRIPGLEHLSAKEATDQVRRWAYQYNVAGHGGQSRELVGAAGASALPGSTLGDFLAGIPGQTRKTLGGALAQLKTAAPGTWNPLNVAGAGSTRDLSAPVVAGRAAGDVVEGVNRHSLFLAKLRQGYSPAEAAREVLEAHFDYSPSSLTAVEHGLKAFVPFYTFSRRNLPFQLEQLAQHPGGLVATEAKAAHDFRQQEGFLPDYLGSGLAVPLGQEEGGLRRYLTGLGLPPEQAFELIHGGPKGAENTVMAALGQLNPVVKGPLEWATGKQFYTGRDAEDLYSPTGSRGADALLMNSPVSKLATQLRTLADERKGAGAKALNLLTGAKVSDVDIDKQRAVAAQEYVRDVLRAQPEVGHFETVYPRQGAVLTPGEQELLRLNKTLEDRAQAAARQKRRVGVQPR